MKKVYGSYLNNAAARGAVDELLQQGYTKDEIKVVSNSDLGNDLSYMDNDHDVDDRGLWEKIKDAFTFDQYDDEYWDKDLDTDERKLLDGYKTNLQDGEVLVLVEEKGNQYNKDIFRDGRSTSDELDADLNEERKIELKKEKLNIDKDVVQTGEVNVKKVVKKETQTIEVPVEKEEIIIERKSVGDKEVRDGDILDTDGFKDGEEIHIPIKEERVDVNKKTVVDDEVVIRKDKHKENKTVTETVKYEDIEVEGDAKVRGETDKDRLNRDIDDDFRKKN